MLTQTVKITLSPFKPDIEVVGPMIFDVRSPYNEKSVTLVINPNITHYEEKPDAPEGIEVRQVVVSQNTDETQSLQFDIQTNNEKEIAFKGINYKIKLLNIGKENIQGQDFPQFEFFIEEQ